MNTHLNQHRQQRHEHDDHHDDSSGVHRRWFFNRRRLGPVLRQFFIGPAIQDRHDRLCRHRRHAVCPCAQIIWRQRSLGSRRHRAGVDHFGHYFRLRFGFGFMRRLDPVPPYGSHFLDGARHAARHPSSDPCHANTDTRCDRPCGLPLWSCSLSMHARRLATTTAQQQWRQYACSNSMIESRTCSISPVNPIAAWVGHNETRVLSLAIKLDVRCAG